MDRVRIGGDIRLLRHRRGWSQGRLGAESETSRWAVAYAEAGHGDRLQLATLSEIVSALGGYLSVRVTFQGEGLDRLRDRHHAALVEMMVQRLEADGWIVASEVSFNHYGERGSIDILAFHAATRTLLVIEVKTVVPDIGGLLSTLDRKVRLAPDIAAERGWRAHRVCRLLVMPEAGTARRRVREHGATFWNAFPARNVEVNAWLRDPAATLSGLVFLSGARVSGRRRPSGRADRPVRAVSRSGA